MIQRQQPSYLSWSNINNSKKRVETYLKLFESSCRTISFFSKLLLRPMEITLRPPDQGLWQVVRNVDDKTVQPMPIRHPDQSGSNPLQGKSLLNCFTAKQPTRPHVKVAICVCVYSEEEEMLKRTLSGINTNYKKFIEEGVSPEEIAVVFIFDGIEKVSKSMESFFEKMDHESNFKWKTYGASLGDILNPEFDPENQKMLDPEYVNIYSKSELDCLNKNLFPEQRREYFHNSTLLVDIRKLKGREGLTFQDLPSEVQNEYVQQLRKQYLELFVYLIYDQKPSAETVMQFFQPPEFQSIRHKCMALALTEIQAMLTRYFDSRKDTALLYSYRYDLNDNFPEEMAEPNENQSVSAESTYQQMTGVRRRQGSHDTIYSDDQPNRFLRRGTISYARDDKIRPYLFMCVKYANAGKLSSQNWFFRGFCAQFKCKKAILLDVGLKPQGDALCKFYSYLDQNPNCGGVCGYMGLAIERPFNELGYYERERRLDCLTRFSDGLFDIQKAQRFEYHFAHMLDKPFESAFGFINVLPGAFSGYNMSLFDNNQILNDYFASLEKNTQAIDFTEDTLGSLLLSVLFPRSWVQSFYGRYDDSKKEKTPYQAMKYKNVCLAEDRILCLGIHLRKMKMAFLPDAWASVDSVIDLQHMLAQRRRWNNGSYFASEQVTEKSGVCSSGIGFALEMGYYMCNSAFSYISIALFYITLDMTAYSFLQDVLLPFLFRFYNVTTANQLNKHVFLGFSALSVANAVPSIINFFYIMMVGGMIFMSLNLDQTNQKFERMYNKVCSAMGWYSIFMYVMLLVSIFGSSSVLNMQEGGVIGSSVLRIIIYVILGVQAIPPIFFFCFIRREFKYLWEVLNSSPSYIFYSASYIHILNLYSICRVDDLSWGTKGLTGDSSQQTSKLKEAWQTEKYIFVGRFLTWNILVGIIIKVLVSQPSIKPLVILIFSLLVGMSLVFRMVFAIPYLLSYKLRQFGKKQSTQAGIGANRLDLDTFYRSYEEDLIKAAVEVKKNELKNENPDTLNLSRSYIKGKMKETRAKFRKPKNNSGPVPIMEQAGEEGSGIHPPRGNKPDPITPQSLGARQAATNLLPPVKAPTRKGKGW